MTETYSILKRLLPHSLRKFIRDLDRAYQERLQEIDLKSRQIAELESSNHSLLTELDSQKLLLEEQCKEINLKSRQIAELESSNRSLLTELDSYRAFLEQCSQTDDPLKQNSHISDEDYEQINKAGLFIVGCARSGTSILCDCLNLSPEVFLLGEANFYLHHNLENFIDFFNNQHLQFKNIRSKGTYIPPSRLPERGGFAFLARMNKNYSHVGEKIAFGPIDFGENQSYQELFFNFQATYFYFSKYILIMRRPTEAIWSMQKMFSETRLNLVFECWLRTIQIQIDIFQSFPNAHVVFFENLSTMTILNLSSVLGINLRIPKGMLREENKYCLLGENEIPDELSQYSEICLACEEIYQQVKNEFSPENFRYKETTANYGNARYGFSSNIQKQIGKVMNKLATHQSQEFIKLYNN